MLRQTRPCDPFGARYNKPSVLRGLFRVHYVATNVKRMQCAAFGLHLAMNNFV